MTIHANCKINIGLNVLRRREDGFHELSTVMYPIKGLYDKVTITPLATSDVKFSSEGLLIDCPPEKNLCVRAARLMQQRYNTPGVHITLNKIVPFGAGLGGGSSDATAVILAMNEIFSLNISSQELIDIAALLGSDTSFFVCNSAQLCSGRGEIMTPLDLELRGYTIAMVKPDVGVSTAQAYGGVCPKLPSTPLHELIQRPIEEWQGQVVNDFESHIFDLHPILGEIKDELLDRGALYASMSGSGSTIYGIFDHPNSDINKPITGYNPYVLPL